MIVQNSYNLLLLQSVPEIIEFILFLLSFITPVLSVIMNFFILILEPIGIVVKIVVEQVLNSISPVADTFDLSWFFVIAIVIFIVAIALAVRFPGYEQKEVKQKKKEKRKILKEEKKDIKERKLQAEKEKKL